MVNGPLDCVSKFGYCYSMKNSETVGARFRRWREALGFTGVNAAKDIGWSRQHLFSFESGAHDPKVSTLEHALSGIGVTIIQFFTEEPPGCKHEAEETMMVVDS